MRLYRPRSFFSLLLSGFVFVSLPLLIALFSSVQILDDLVHRSTDAVLRSVNRAENSRQLIELLHNQERAARLFNVLGEPDHLQDVNSLYSEAETILRKIAQHNENENFLELIEQILTKARYIVDVFNTSEGPADKLKIEREASLSIYTDINVFTTQMEHLSNNLILSDVNALKDRVGKNKTMLVWLVSGLIGFSVLLVIVFISLIIRPVHQIDKGIDRLGEGDFSTPIVVSGSRDLEVLGEKMDWLRKRLDKLDKEKVKMIAHISHELKTPLASIREGACLLKEGLVGTLSSQQQEVVTILDNNSEKLQLLIQNILDFNMAQAMELPDNIEKNNLKLIIEEVAEDHHNGILAHHITLDLDLENAVIECNRQQIKTVFDNLLANAVKFTPDEGKIRIVMRKNPKHVNIIVEDSGPGVSKEDRAQIFSPFFQGKQLQKSTIKGSGLGLAISKEYVQNCGGNLRLLQNTGGACFSVSIPCIQGGTK